MLTCQRSGTHAAFDLDTSFEARYHPTVVTEVSECVLPRDIYKMKDAIKRRSQILSSLASLWRDLFTVHFFLLLRGVEPFSTGRTVFLPFTHGPRGFVLSWSAIKAFSAASRGVSKNRLMECAMQLLRSLISMLVFLQDTGI